jgi:hypothetical protein
MVRGGLIVADNAVNHAETLAPFLDRAHADPRVDAMILPFDNGELIARNADSGLAARERPQPGDDARQHIQHPVDLFVRVAFADGQTK